VTICFWFCAIYNCYILLIRYNATILPLTLVYNLHSWWCIAFIRIDHFSIELQKIQTDKIHLGLVLSIIFVLFENFSNSFLSLIYLIYFSVVVWKGKLIPLSSFCFDISISVRKRERRTVNKFAQKSPEEVFSLTPLL
jgi:hypothetical protein